MGLTQKPRLRTSKPCQNMLWQGLFSLQNDFWITPMRLYAHKKLQNKLSYLQVKSNLN